MKLDAEKQRSFAVEVVERLVDQGFTAYWAGGCVRDRLLGREPKDYDVATNALPDEVRRLFGPRRTHAVGAAFGVITVVGPRAAGHVEVATFRRDASYSDGRHPDAVEYSSPVDDASRRDFTINGLFYDPLRDEVIDLVGGQADLDRRVVRAIGDPRARISEDKLRMLRAVRFSATFNFALEEETRLAIIEMAHQIVVVSAERIAQEMRLLFTLPNRSAGLLLLAEVGLLPVLLPELASIVESDRWRTTLAVLSALESPSFPLALAAALAQLPSPAEAVDQVGRRWKLANKERERAQWLVRQQGSLWDARSIRWPKLQRLLIEPGIDDLLVLHQAIGTATDRNTTELEFCRQWLARPAEELNPPPLVSGHDLIEHGFSPGASFQKLLEEIRDAQLEGKVSTRAEALTLADSLRASRG
jgi:tRNA nucleotidyltransferase/poly(A) polymerase